MVKTAEKIRIYPYQILNPLKTTLKEFQDKFKFANIPRNQVIYDGIHTLVLVIDFVLEGKYICGRLFKLRKYIPSVLDKVKATEREIQLLPNEDVKETSHFLWAFNDGILIGEYNYHGARHFSSPLYYYLNKSFKLIREKNEDEEDDENDKEMFDILPLEELKTLEMAKKDVPKSLFVRVSDKKIKQLEKENKVDVMQFLKDFCSEGEGYLEIGIKPRRGKKLEKKNLFAKVLALKEQGIARSILVQGEEAKYDLINNNIQSSFLDVTYDTARRTVSSREYYEKAKEYYENNKKSLTSSADS